MAARAWATIGRGPQSAGRLWRLSGWRSCADTGPAGAAVSEQPLYECRVDLAARARKAWTRCQLGSSLGLVGFAGVATGAGAAGPTVPAVVCAGAAFFAYKHLVLSRRGMADASMRHVESIHALLPPLAAESDDTVRLGSLGEVELRIRTASLDVRLKLTEPSSGVEGGKYAGFVADERPAFASVCHGGLLHLEDLAAGSEMAELGASQRVIAEHGIEAREDVDGLFAAQPGATKSFAAALASVREEGAGGRAPLSPLQEVDQLGQQALAGGLVFLLAGGLFTGRSLARSYGDGGSGTDPTLRDFLKFVKFA